MKIKENILSPMFSNINPYRVIHGVKTAIACLLGLALETYFAWPMGQWVPITIIVVMSAQTHFGGAVRKAFMRFLGTAGGVFTTVAVLWLFGDNIWVVFSTIFFAGIIFTYIASSHGDISYAGTLGGVTVVLILTSQQVSIETAFERGFYIVVGIIIALLVSRFIFPIHARDRLRYHIAITLRNLSKLYLLVVQPKEERQESRDKISEKLTSEITDDIADQPRLIYEAVIGSRKFAIKKPIFTAILGSEQSLNRLIGLMHFSVCETTIPTMLNKQLKGVAKVHDIIVNNLNHLADCMKTREQPQKAVGLQEALAEIAKVARGLSKEEETQQLIVESSYLFLMEELLKELENIGELIAKANSKNEDYVV